MPSTFHTFKLVSMASNNNRQLTPILPPSTPANGSKGRPSPLQQHANLQHDVQTSTPTSESRMHPPPLPRPLMTPARDMRESSVVSSAAGSGSRKPRQNLDERDHILMVKHCLEQRGGFKEGTKAQFWTGVNNAFQKDTGKVLAQMSATVGRLVEARRRQISDWEAGVIPQKPGGELNDMLDEWMAFLKVEDRDAEAERMRQVDARRKVEEARKEARRQAIAAETAAAALGQADGLPIYTPVSQSSQSQQGSQVQSSQQPQQHQQQQPKPLQQLASNPPPSQYHQHAQPAAQMVVATVATANGLPEVNGYRPHKRKRQNEREITHELQEQIHQEQAWHASQSQSQSQSQSYAVARVPTPELPRRVIVEGAMTKEDWREVMGNDARLRALENKVDKIELLVSQNNKLLLQLISNQSKEREHQVEEERVPVHLDADFERDYL